MDVTVIDIIFLILVIIAIVKGYRKGFIIAVFSIIAFIAGLAAALKLSAVVAVYLQHNTTVSSKWLPVISFALVFVVVVLLVHLGGKLIEKSLELALLGWANRLGGVFLYVILYTIIFSIFLFYASKINMFPATTMEASQSYPFIQPIGPKVINSLGKIIPVFKDMFSQLEAFFEGVSHKIQQ